MNMPITTRAKMMKKVALIFIAQIFLSSTVWAYGSRDPILETQSKTVPVTEESLKEDAKSGAPAPTFKLVHDTGVFFVKSPIELLEEESVKKWQWSEAPAGEKSEPDEEYDISHY